MKKLGTILSIATIVALFGLYIHCLHIADSNMRAYAYTYEPAHTGHMICAIAESYDNYILAEMPDHSLQIYEIEDAPEDEMTHVCFEYTEQDDYTTYKVVALY